MTYIEKKYNIKFFFDENNRLEHEQSFGCCSFHKYCIEEGFCIIPESYSDAKKLCQMSHRLGYDKIKAKKVITKRIKKFKKIKRKKD
jgi:hypothetical protein